MTALEAASFWISGLLDLIRREVERFALAEYRLPRQIPPDRLVEVLQPRLVHGQEHERVAIDPGYAAPRFQDGFRGGLGRIARSLL